MGFRGIRSGSVSAAAVVQEEEAFSVFAHEPMLQFCHNSLIDIYIYSKIFRKNYT